ncbi:MAG: DDE-type integrase/transposase/recombinase [Halioglobus sp.]
MPKYNDEFKEQVVRKMMPPNAMSVAQVSRDTGVSDVTLYTWRNHGGEPRKIVTDKLRSYGVAHRELIPETIQSTKQYENNRAEQSHEATRVRERGMRKFKSVRQAQRSVTGHAAVHNLFNRGRHLVSANHYRDLSVSAFADWSRAVA